MELKIFFHRSVTKSYWAVLEAFTLNLDIGDIPGIYLVIFIIDAYYIGGKRLLFFRFLIPARQWWLDFFLCPQSVDYILEI